jgi:hypothetical protein
MNTIIQKLPYKNIVTDKGESVNTTHERKNERKNKQTKKIFPAGIRFFVPDSEVVLRRVQPFTNTGFQEKGINERRQILLTF